MSFGSPFSRPTESYTTHLRYSSSSPVHTGLHCSLTPPLSLHLHILKEEPLAAPSGSFLQFTSAHIHHSDHYVHHHGGRYRVPKYLRQDFIFLPNHKLQAPVPSILVRAHDHSNGRRICQGSLPERASHPSPAVPPWHLGD